MFNKPLIKALRQELSRTRADCRDWKRRYDELLDRTIFQVRPVRVQGKTAPSDERQVVSEGGDLYTMAMQDAENLALEGMRNSTDGQPDAN
jgi:hypothetical protein